MLKSTKEFLKRMKKRIPVHSLIFRLSALILALSLLPFAGAFAEVYMDQQPPAEWDNLETLTWTIFDVNEGDAMLLSCGGEHMMVDGGPRPFREQLRDALDARDLRHLNYIFCTHYHDDHIDGLYYLLTYGFTADKLFHSYSDWALDHDERGRRTVDAAIENGVPVERIGDGYTFTLGGANLRVFQCTEFSNTNARSLVLRVDFKDSSILLCADIIGDTQDWLVKNHPDGTFDTDLIKLPHHGITPTHTTLLDVVTPEAAIVTNRYDNLEYGSKSQIRKYPLNAKFAGEGTIYCVTDGTDWYIYQTKGEF